MNRYKIMHRETGEVFREEAISKTSLKKDLVRFNGYEYCSFWTIVEVDLNEWNKMKRDGIEKVPAKYRKW